MPQKVFKYKLDFYYQQTLIYLVTLVLYAGIRGSFVEDQFSFVFKDPIVYIIIVFFVVAVAALFLNVWRGRRLVIEHDRIVFQTRTQTRSIPFTEIEWMHIGRERLVQTAGRFQQVTLRLRGRPLPIRIRVGRYERDRELVAEMEQIAARVPGRGPRRFRLGRRRR
jgi:hypothetical protein